MAPALGVTGCLLLCLIIFHQQAELSTLSTVVGLLLALTSTFAYYLHRKQYPWASPLLFACLLGAAAGWNNALWQAHQRQGDQLLPACEGIPLWADITVADLPTPIDIGIKWTGEVTHFTPTAECPRLPSRISMGWYTGFSSKTAGPPPPIHVGQVWHLPIKLKRTVAPLQFDGFDVQAYWFANQIGATGSVQARLAKSQAAVIDHRFSIGIGIEQSREFFRAHMQRALGDRPLAGVIVALVLGDQKAITASQWRVFTATGIGHLVSISGMHITLFAALSGFVVLQLWKRSVRLCTWVPAPKAAALIGFIFAMAYSLLAGWGVPAQRTVWMLCAVVLGVLVQTRPSPVHILSFAAGLLMLLDPWCVLSAGFWLSFGAVALLMYSSVGRYRLVKPRYLAARQALHAQWVVTVGLVPLSCMMFSQLSLVSPLANAFAIPWVSFVVTPLAMLGTFTGLDWPLVMAHQTLQWIMALLEPMAAWSWATVPVAQQPHWVMAMSLAGVLWLLAPRGIPGKSVAWVLMTSLWWWPASKPAPGEFWMDAMDIGQGNALAIQTQHHTLIYDTGPAPNPQADSGARVVVPWLNQHGVAHPDMLIVSHQDSDHSGGVPSVFELTAPRQFSSSIPTDHPLVRKSAEHGVPYTPCRQGQRWEWDGVQFEILFPREEDFSTWDKPNDTCCVLRIATATHSALLGGDIGVAQERALIERMPASIDTDILLVPHHGSKTSSSEAFLDATTPQLALFQLGYRNRYGHPKPEIVSRYETRRIPYLRSDRSGAIALRIRAQGPIEWQQAKIVKKRYWHVEANTAVISPEEN